MMQCDSGLTPETLSSITDGTSGTLMVCERHLRDNGPRRREPFCARACNLYQTSASFPTIGNSYRKPVCEACATLTGNSNYGEYG
ncbi:MAG: hypothetical protein U0746_06965 [Gemmataceae bacterium]